MRRISLTTLLLAATVLLATEGCGGSSGGGGGNPPGNPFAGTYQGMANLDNGKTGALGFEVQDDGTAVGFLTVTAPSGAPSRLADDEFPPSVYDISGTVDGAGLLAMAGDITGGTFEVGGTLSNDGSPAPITVAKVNGAVTYNGTVQTQSDEPTGNITMTQIQVGNAHLDHYSSKTLTVTVQQQEGFLKVFFTESAEFGGDNRSLDIEIPDDMQPGEVVILDNNQPRLMYGEFNFVNPVMKSWMSASGAMTLVSRSGNKVAVMLSDVVFNPVVIGPNQATGAFKISGTIHN